MSQPIPQPPTIPIFGNIHNIDPKHGMESLGHLAEKYGPIFKLSFFGTERYFVSSYELFNELCDEKRFCKSVSGAVYELRPGISDGLFTAFHGEHNWEIAHRVLVPAFGPLGIKDMFDEMYDIASQLISKWARLGPDQPINVTEDFTRLTLDSIALCAMDKRFNSFYSDEMHPFVGAMVGFLSEAGMRTKRTRIERLVNRGPEHQFEQDIAVMKSVAEDVIATRLANPTPKKDLLNAMLFGKDPQTGEKLSHDSVISNMITFLIAGHETTSGLLSFTSYFLMKNPEVFHKAQQEVDHIVGKGPVTFQHMSKLPYIEACLRESLRLHPTAPGFTLEPLPDTAQPVVLGGKYYIPPKATILSLLPKIGRDPTIFGADADEFKPERMMGESFDKLPPNAWKPFGSGARGCIGRPFAWQEAILILAMILQKFNIRFASSDYRMHIKQTLTIKPEDLFMKVRLREGIDPIGLEKSLYASPPQGAQPKTHQVPSRRNDAEQKPISILYGSNAGTCEGLAQSLASEASSHGYKAAVQPLDNAAAQFPTNQPVIIITASYEGNPPDNAGQFVEWLKNAEQLKFKGSKFAVFGCGHHDWIATYQKVPKLIDSLLAEKGAKAIIGRGETDVAQGTVFDDFDEWQDKLLWPALTGGGASDAVDVESLEIEISTSTRASHLNHNVQEALVLKNELLTSPGIQEKRHMEFKLPTNMTYESGDYLALLPINNVPTIGRVLRRFGLPWDAMMTLKKGSYSTLPTDIPLSVAVVLGAYVELSAPASRKNIATISLFADEAVKESLSLMASSAESVLEILESHPSVALPFAQYISMLPPMRIRQYSISSSPLADPTVVSITYAVLEHQNPDHPHLGVATNYLRALLPGSKVQISIKKSHASFHLPREDANIPIIMVAAGTGLAPFRGFVQERASKITAAKAVGQEAKLAEAVLFIGCKSPADLLYPELFSEWETLGAVKVFHAFSRDFEKSSGARYAQDRAWLEREHLITLYDEGARTYICGSSRLGKGAADVAAKIGVQAAKAKGIQRTYDEALKRWESLRGERFAVDVFD